MSATQLAKLVLGFSLILFGLALLFDLAARPAHGAGFDVCAIGCPYTTIQQAVDAAAPGGTVTVAQGNYTESVSITKPLTVRGGGAGYEPWERDGSESTLAGTHTDANGYRAAFIVTAPDVTIDGFVLGPQVPDTAHSNVGVMVTGVVRTILRNIQYRNLLVGVNADQASGLQVDGSMFVAAYIGVSLMSSSHGAIGTRSSVRFMNITYAAIDLETVTDTLIQRIELTNAARAIVAFGSDRTRVSGASGSIGVTGFELGNDHGFSISDAALSGGSGSGLQVDGQTGPSSDVSLIRSSFTGFANRLMIADGALSTPLIESDTVATTTDADAAQSTVMPTLSGGSPTTLGTAGVTALGTGSSVATPKPTLLPATGPGSDAFMGQFTGAFIGAAMAAGSGTWLLRRQ